MRKINYLNEKALLEDAQTIQFENPEMITFLNMEEIRLVDIQTINYSTSDIINHDYAVIKKNNKYDTFNINIPMEDKYSASIIEFVKSIIND